MSDAVPAWCLDLTDPRSGVQRTCAIYDERMFGERWREGMRADLIAKGWRCSEWQRRTPPPNPMRDVSDAELARILITGGDDG